MKATMIVLAVLCLVVGGIAGWALKGALAKPAAPALMVDVTPSEFSGGCSRVAIYENKTLTIADCDADGRIVSADQRKMDGSSKFVSDKRTIK